MKLTFSVIQQSDLAEMADVLGQSFSTGEPMALAAGLTQADVANIVEIFGPKADGERLSVVARLASGEMTGALLAQDFATPAPDGLATVTVRFHPIGALLDGLDDAYRRGKEIEPGAYLHLFMLGVQTTHAGQGIGRGLVSAALQNARALGYTMAITEATGGGSQHIFRQLGFVERITQKYSDYRFEGEPIFRTVEGVAGAMLMDRSLS